MGKLKKQLYFIFLLTSLLLLLVVVLDYFHEKYLKYEHFSLLKMK